MEYPVQQRIAVVGGGIAGTIIALLLQQKGWKPIILEKVHHVTEVGLAIVMQPNGLKVLNKAGVAGVALEGTLPWLNWNDWSSSGEFLGGIGSKTPEEYVDRFGWPAVGVSRTQLQVGFKNAVEKAGIPYLTAWRLKDIHVKDNSVSVISDDGKEIEAAFVIGADGLKSATRDVITARHGVQDRDPHFTGIEVIGGRSPTPQFLKDRQGLNCFWGATETIITHPLEGGFHVWGATVPRDRDVPESWSTIPPDQLEAEKQGYLERWHDWPETVQTLIKTANKMQRIGLYDRGELPIERWYHDRMILIGDAAHPTTPHAGQGANQCLEDAWAVTEELPAFESGKNIATSDLANIFRAVAEKRQPLSSSIMTYALEQGESRVLRGDRASVEGQKERDDGLKKKWADIDAVRKEQDGMLKQPFDDVGGFSRWQKSTK